MHVCHMCMVPLEVRRNPLISLELKWWLVWPIIWNAGHQTWVLCKSNKGCWAISPKRSTFFWRHDLAIRQLSSCFSLPHIETTGLHHHVPGHHLSSFYYLINVPGYDDQDALERQGILGVVLRMPHSQGSSISTGTWMTRKKRVENEGESNLNKERLKSKGLEMECAGFVLGWWPGQHGWSKLASTAVASVRPVSQAGERSCGPIKA